MKIVKPGRPQKGWSKKFKCTGKGNGGGGCGAVLLVEEGDLYTTSSSHYDGSNDYYTTFTCVACGVRTDVEVPSGVKVHSSEQAWRAAKAKEEKARQENESAREDREGK
jgi:transcription elongation factor Elf1